MRRQSDRQRGAVLVISLVILLILTIIGVSAVRTSALDARIVANLAEDRTAYQVAETGIELQIQKVSDVGIGDFESAYVATDKTYSPTIATGDLNMADTSVTIEIESLGLGGYARGSSIPRFRTSRFSIHSTAERAGSKARAVHSRGLDILIPGT
ncbi:MAG: PilX N-terminal domain-containing pilus assembly protein [Candidatus Sedimenticola endophacoides]